MFKIEMFLNENKTGERGRDLPKKHHSASRFKNIQFLGGKREEISPKNTIPFPQTPIFNFSVGTGRDFPKNAHPVSRISIFLAK